MTPSPSMRTYFVECTSQFKMRVRQSDKHYSRQTPWGVNVSDNKNTKETFSGGTQKYSFGRAPNEHLVPVLPNTFARRLGQKSKRQNTNTLCNWYASPHYSGDLQCTRCTTHCPAVYIKIEAVQVLSFTVFARSIRASSAFCTKQNNDVRKPIGRFPFGLLRVYVITSIFAFFRSRFIGGKISKDGLLLAPRASSACYEKPEKKPNLGLWHHCDPALLITSSLT